MKNLLIMLAIIGFAFIPSQKERQYTVTIPQSLLVQYWQVIHGEGDNLTVKQYKELLPYLENPIRDQVAKYHLEDSLAARKDSLKLKK